MNPYTLDELYILYGYLENETGHYYRLIRKALVRCNREQEPENLLEFLYYEKLADLFKMPLEEVPLHINDDQGHVRVVMKWRMEIAR